MRMSQNQSAGDSRYTPFSSNCIDSLGSADAHPRIHTSPSQRDASHGGKARLLADRASHASASSSSSSSYTVSAASSIESRLDLVAGRVVQCARQVATADAKITQARTLTPGTAHWAFPEPPMLDSSKKNLQAYSSYCFAFDFEMVFDSTRALAWPA